jgi:Fe-S-cluster containining protein
MRKFECIKCGKCCSHLIGFRDDVRFGMYLSPEEVKLFPSEMVIPLFRHKKKIIAYQLKEDHCPHLTADNLCEIYDKRPLLCRTFPMVSPTEMAAQLCPVTSPYADEQWDLSNMQDSLKAFKEQEREAELLPDATAMFLIDKEWWVEYN